MIYSLSGKLIKKNPGFIVIDCCGVGYFVHITINTFKKLPLEGENVTLLTVFIVKEDSMNLYGFLTEEEREIFKELISVSNIGPKTALTILSSHSAEEIYNHITLKEIGLLSKIKGIGKKTAERIILELSEKLKRKNYFSNNKLINVTNLKENNLISNEINEVLLALAALGYNSNEANKLIENVSHKYDLSSLKVEEILKLVLKEK